LSINISSVRILEMGSNRKRCRGVAGRGSREAEATLYVCEAGLRRLKTLWVSVEPAKPALHNSGGIYSPAGGMG